MGALLLKRSLMYNIQVPMNIVLLSQEYMGIAIFIFYQTIQSQPTFVLKYACSKVKINNKNNDLFLQLLSVQLKKINYFL